jgi:hypothetical protein
MVRRFLLKLMIVLGVVVGILWVLFFIREQNYLQLSADYTQFSSEADVQAYLNQKLEVGESTESEVIAFIIQTGIASKIDPAGPSNCARGKGRAIEISCQVRAPATDYSNENWMDQIIHNTLNFEYYLIRFEFEDGKLKQIGVYPFIHTGWSF